MTETIHIQLNNQIFYGQNPRYAKWKKAMILYEYCEFMCHVTHLFWKEELLADNLVQECMTVLEGNCSLLKIEQ